MTGEPRAKILAGADHVPVGDAKPPGRGAGWLWLARVLGVAILYLATAKLGFLMAIHPGNVTAVWPPSGIALAALLIWGNRLWPGIWLGAFLANTWVFKGSAVGLVDIAVGASIGVGSVLQALAGAWLLRRWIGGNNPFTRAAHVFKFVVVAMVVCFVSSTVGVSSLCMAGMAKWAEFGGAWLTWWLGDLAGVLVVTPLLLAWGLPAARGHGARLGEALLMFFTLAVTILMVFGHWLQNGRYPLGFLVFPSLIWAALRFHQRVVTLAIAGLAGVAIWWTAHGDGPFVMATTNESLLLLQTFVGVVTLATLILFAAVAEGKATQQALEQDIRRREAAEAELLRSRGQVEAIVHSVDGIVWEADLPTFQFTFVSQQAERILGYPVKQWLAGPTFWKDHLHPEDRDAAVEFCVASTEKMLAHEFEYRMLAADGREVWLKDFVTVVVVEGRPAQLRGIMVDITARRRAEQRSAAFASLARRLNTANDVQMAGRIIVEVADELFGWDACTLVLYDARTGRCSPVFNMDMVNGQRTEVPPAYAEREPSPRLRRVMEAGAELILREEPAGMTPDSIPFGDTRRPSASLLFVPVRDGQKVIGVLSIQSYRRNAYTPADLAALQALADHCGGALERIQSRESQRASEVKYRTLIEHMGEGLVQVDEDDIIRFVNPQICRMLGYTAAEMLGQHAATLLNRDEDRAAMAARNRRRFQGVSEGYEIQLRKKSGEFLLAWNSATPVARPAGRVSGSMAIITDITGRRQAEEELREKEHRLSESQRIAHVGSWTGELTGQITWSDETYRIYGVSPDTFQPSAEAILNLIHPEDRLGMQQWVAACLAGEKPGDLEFRTILPDGTVRFVSGRGELMCDAGGRPTHMAGTAQDITGRKRAEAALRQSGEQLRALAARLQSIREEERTHIAREIHDVLGQLLTALKMDLGALDRQMAKVADAAVRAALAAKAASAAGLADELIEIVHHISAELRPSILDNIGLPAAVRFEARRFAQRSGIACEVVESPESLALAPDHATGVFRILQEMLTNVARHAGATRVDIRLAAGGGALMLETRDNGRGTDEHALSNVKSLGLLGMRERARLMGGELAIHGAAGRGTTVTLTIPAEDSKQGGA